MTVNQTLFLTSVLLAALAAASPARAAIQIDDVVLDPAIQKLVTEDLGTIDRLDFDVAAETPFVKIFGGPRGSDVTRYLEERIQYIGKDADPESAKDDETNYASNFGPSFLSYVYKRDILQDASAVPEEARFRNESVKLDSPRTGFMAMGAVYTAPETSQMDRLDTLVHEARHSDCPALPNAADLAHYDKDEYLQMSVASQACSHIHMPCPDGHPLKGELACDNHPWGAYAVAYVYSKTAFSSCRGCTEQQKQEALASATEDFTRLSKKVQKGILNGTAPAPDMGSIR